MFWGEHSVRFDEKARFFLPARFRPLVAGEVAVLPDPSGKRCLTVLTSQDFNRRVLPMLEASLTAQKSQDFTRRLGRLMMVSPVDKQGRVSLSSELLAHAEIDRDALVIGALNRAEIWTPDNWATECARIESEAEAGTDEEGIAVL